MNDTLKEAALQYADMGFAVFPIIPPRFGGKSPGKRPYIAEWQRDASTEKEKVSQWWSKYPDANIGIATGKKSGGLVILDFDKKEEKGIDATEFLRDWERDHGELPDTWRVISSHGGYHYYYRDNAPHGCRAGLYPGVDIRGDGGYIVAPPSILENGREYEWEQGPGDGIEIAKVNDKVLEFLSGPKKEDDSAQGFKMPEQIPEGQRTQWLVKMVCSMQAKGASDGAISVAVKAENEAKCVPPLSDEELEKEVFPALKRYEKGTDPYIAVSDQGRFRQQKNHSLEMVTMELAEEKEPDWLITDYMPRYQITSLAGDGGSGKTTVWCSIAAAVSSGNRSFLLDGMVPSDFAKCNPEKVMFFSAEDSFEYTLKRRLRENGANLSNILSIDIADERFQDIKFNSYFLEQLLEKYRPALCIFDPIQAFVPPDIRMGDRNAMRSCLAPLIGYGEKYGTTFLIVEHANKQSGVWGRKRIADSADIWDISRSVIMAGETNEPGVRYLSHEKSNYGPTGSTVLYSIEDEVIRFKGYTIMKDKDFVSEASYNTRQAPAKAGAKELILDFLMDGEKEVSELDELAKIEGVSKNAMRDAKAELKKEGRTKTWCVGYGKEKKWFIRLVEDLPMHSEETNK